jgi:diguanylate cyclase (GGDEF)-like protein
MWVRNNLKAREEESRKKDTRISELENVRSAFEELAHIDDLTRLLNYRGLSLLLEREAARASRSGESLSILFMDIDHFKEVNDTYGHLEGDSILRRLGNLLQATTRMEETAARYGGEEIVIVLVNSNQAHSAAAGERYRRSIEAEFTKRKENDPSITVSVGVATFGTEKVSSIEDLLAAADGAMYAAKAKGRNSVCVFDAKSITPRKGGSDG